MAKLTKAISALVLGVTLAGATATAADAQRWRGGRGDYYRGGRGGVSTGTAVGIGILGLGLGAAIASRPRYYDGGGYGGGYGRGGYGGGGYDRGYYRGGGGGYYVRPAYGYGYGQRCVTRRIYDPYIGRRVRIRDCG